MFDTALSGIEAANARMSVSAHNTANINTAGYNAYGVTQRELAAGGTAADVYATNSPTNYANEAVEQMIAGYAVQQNIVVIRSVNHMTGSLINMLA